MHVGRSYSFTVTLNMLWPVRYIDMLDTAKSPDISRSALLITSLIFSDNFLLTDQQTSSRSRWLRRGRVCVSFIWYNLPCELWLSCKAYMCLYYIPRLSTNVFQMQNNSKSHRETTKKNMGCLQVWHHPLTVSTNISDCRTLVH